MQPEELFPYPEIRPAQLELMRAAREIIDSGGHLVVEGPTGMGKTVALLCSLLSSPRVDEYKVVYCCRTHKQMDRVIEELRAMKARITALSMRGKREMCLNRLMRFVPSASEAAQVCAILKRRGKCEFFERRGSSRVLREFFDRPVTAGEILSVCRREELCPYELAKELLGEARLAAVSYLYILDPSIRGGFLQEIGERLENLVIVFDEAHNLPATASEIASDRLTSTSISLAVREAEEAGEKKLSRELTGWFRFLQGFAGEIFGEKEGEKLLEGREVLNGLEAPAELAERAEEVGENILWKRVEEGRAPRSHLRHLSSFLALWVESCGMEEYLHILSKRRAQFSLELSVLDPRIITQEIWDCWASVSMSGTLAPLEAYRDLVGLPSTARLLELPSPFPEENVLCLATEGVTTKEEFRLPQMYQKINEKLAEICEEVPANVGIFTASYEVLRGLVEAGLEKRIRKPLLVEAPEMSSAENDELVGSFKSFARKGGAVLLGVMGGRNSEGGDFPGDEMNAVVLVGIPYAPPDARLEAAIGYYEKQFPKKGKFYAYYLPAHRKLCQAAGRAHRLVTDRAAVIFLDRRVLTRFVASSLPSWLRRKLERVPDKKGELGRRLREFFTRTPADPRPSCAELDQTVGGNA
ncbi:MAG: ATP-dependent DNA helicase [Candidatus Hadarchaeales archaeon]